MWKNDIIKFIKFSIVGLSNTIVSIFSFYIIFNFFGIYYIIASTFGYLMGLVNSYFWNLRWTFKHQHSIGVLTKFIIVNILALTIKLIIMRILVENYLFQEIYAEVIAMGFAIIINFSGNRFWTFNKN